MALTKTAVRRRTRDIRRAAALIENRADAWAGAVARSESGRTLQDVLSEPAQRAYLTELLNEIDGTSAQLRELLTGGEL